MKEWIGSCRACHPLTHPRTQHSYIATCVVSSISACEYLSKVVDVSPILAAVGLLCLFAALVLTGLKESSSIAFAIFVVHCVTLLTLAVMCFAFAASEGFSVLYLNMDEPYPRVKIAGSEMASSLGVALFLGFSSAMLGVSGYETTVRLSLWMCVSTCVCDAVHCIITTTHSHFFPSTK